MEIEYGFAACRVCLACETEETLSDLFEDGNRVEIFQLVFGFEIYDDKDKHRALICNKCLKYMRRAFMLRKRARKAEKHYFKPRRDEYYEIQTSEETFDKTMPSQSQLYGSSIISSTRNMIERPSEDEDSEPGYESDIDDEDYQPSKKDDISEESVDYDKTLIPEQQHSGLKEVEEPLENEEKSFNCLVCHKKFPFPIRLRLHLEEVHLKIKRFSCDQCEAKFYQKSNMKQHLQRHLKNSNQKYRCTSDNQRPFKCDFENCGKFFNVKGNLLKHQSVHSDDRPFVCWCGKAYKQKYNLKAHQITASHENSREN